MNFNWRSIHSIVGLRKRFCLLLSVASKLLSSSSKITKARFRQRERTKKLAQQHKPESAKLPNRVRKIYHRKMKRKVVQTQKAWYQIIQWGKAMIIKMEGKLSSLKGKTLNLFEGQNLLNFASLSEFFWDHKEDSSRALPSVVEGLFQGYRATGGWMGKFPDFRENQPSSCVSSEIETWDQDPIYNT